jgi:hypothetical protein
MANLADIPPLLLDKWKKYEFLLWLNELPIHKTDKRELAKTWATSTHIDLTPTDWATIT